MQYIGERPDLSHGFVDRRDDLVAQALARRHRFQPGADTHQTETCSNQMLAGRIVKLGSYALLYAILNGSKADTASKIGDAVGIVLERRLDGRLEGRLGEWPVRADQLDNDARRGINDRNDDCLDVLPQATERQAVVNFNFGFLCHTRM